MMTTSPPAMASPSPSTTIWESAAVTSTGGSNSTTGSASRSSLIVTPSRAPGPSPPPSEPPPSEGPVPPSDPESSLQAAMPRAAVAARAVDSRERRRINAGAFRIGCPGGGARAPGYGLGPEELSGRRSGLGGSGHVYGPDLGEQGVDLGQGGREGVQDLHRHRAGPGQAQCGPVHDVIDAVLLGGGDHLAAQMGPRGGRRDGASGLDALLRQHLGRQTAALQGLEDAVRRVDVVVRELKALHGGVVEADSVTLDDLGEQALLDGPVEVGGGPAAVPGAHRVQRLLPGLEHLVLMLLGDGGGELVPALLDLQRCGGAAGGEGQRVRAAEIAGDGTDGGDVVVERSEEHTSELQS